MDSTPPEQTSSNALDKYRHFVQVKYQKFLDDTIPYLPIRWAATFFVLTIYLIRVYSLGGWYIVTYALGIYLLNLLIGFLSPQWDPETEDSDSLNLPTKGDDEFKPFVRKLPEFKFWYSVTRAIVIALVCTFFSFLDIPVFWPILLIYFIALFTVTMKKQIKHMLKHKYIPFTTGKPKYQSNK